ncbi:MAG TPA: tripartite tricarboxylate transporter substrate binding protein [Burkholderiales bacterium]|nr:tripartite tricarboxylate transporter substrate binding protein [Burkholderiales bacterium]
MSKLAARFVSPAFVLCACSAFAADNYPARPIRIVDPFSPGGSTEAQARALAQKLNEAWGQPVVIDARPGAGSSLGSSVVAQATPDGYTLLMNNVGLVTSALLAKRPPYEPTKDFAGVIMTGTQPQFIVVNPSLPSTLKEFIAYAKANPGKVNFGSSGVGGSSHLSMEYFKIATGTDLTHVPYKGSNPSATAIIAGEIQMGSFSGNSVLPHIRSGKMRALAVTTLKRAAVMPEVPTADEQGLKGYEVVTWGGIFAPAKTPPAIVAKLNQQMNAALQTADVKERYARIGVDVSGGAPAVLNKLLASEQKRWGKVVADAKIPKE